MSVRRAAAPLALPLLGLLLILVAGPRTAGANPAAIKRIESLNETATAAYDAGDNQKAKSLLLEAVVLSKESGVGSPPAVARSYVQLGMLHVEGLKDEDKGVRYFTLALRIQPDVKLSPRLATAP